MDDKKEIREPIDDKINNSPYFIDMNIDDTIELLLEAKESAKKLGYYDVLIEVDGGGEWEAGLPAYFGTRLKTASEIEYDLEIQIICIEVDAKNAIDYFKKEKELVRRLGGINCSLTGIRYCLGDIGDSDCQKILSEIRKSFDWPVSLELNTVVTD